MSDSVFTSKWNDASEIDTNYTRVSILAVVSLFCGIVSVLLFFSLWFTLFPVLALIFALFALWAIRNAEGGLTGKGFAYTAIALSVLSVVFVTVFWQTYIVILNRQSDRLFRDFFAAALDNDTQQMMDCFTLSTERKKLDAETWWQERYAKNGTHYGLHNFADNKTVRTLAALGKKAKITYYRTPALAVGDENDTVVKYYAVTYTGAAGTPETFFVKMSGIRLYDKKAGAYGWRISAYPEFIVPEEYKEHSK
ncbi:MAG: DUF4190 domain-containing protein [Planctomycetaceae bacterium]|jgi:hypothetical protein|nr:DUF4190 domain-containing protein [Planctomycetaceae bacterium]